MKRFKVKFTAKNLMGNAGLVHLGKFNVFLAFLNGFGRCLPRADSGFFNGALLEPVQELFSVLK